MARLVKVILILLTGVLIGWSLNQKFVTSRGFVAQQPTYKIQNQRVNKVSEDSSDRFDPHLMFLDLLKRSHGNLGKEYALARERLVQNQQQALDKQLVIYVDSLYRQRASDDKVLSKLNNLLIDDSTDKYVLAKIALIYSERKAYKKAIDTLIALDRWSQFPTDSTKVQEAISQNVQANIHALKGKKDNKALESFFEFLADEFPTNYNYRWDYAQFEGQQKEYDTALYLLQELRYIPEYSKKVVQLTDKINFFLANPDTNFGTIKLGKLGENFVVNAVVNQQMSVKLILDTGASMTIISPKLASALDLFQYESGKKAHFQTANGDVFAPVANLANLSIGDYSFNNLLVGILPISDNSEIQGLLGMNFLKHYKFFIDQQNLTLELSTLN